MTIRVTIDGRNTLESSDAYCALARTKRVRVVGNFSVDALFAACSGIRRRKRYQFTATMAPTTGAVHATKMPATEVRMTTSGSNANFATPNAMFSTATHRDARNPIRTES